MSFLIFMRLANRNSLVISVLIFFSFKATTFGQHTIKGNVLNQNNEPISFCSVVLEYEKKVLGYTYSDDLGNFSLDLDANENKMAKLIFSSISYESKTIDINLETTLDKITVLLNESNTELKEVVINAIKPVIIKKDTVEFNVKSFLKGNEQVVEDLLKNIPGLDVDSDGTIKVGNQEIEKVMVEGDDFFEKGYKVLTKNMPTDPIKKVEILKRYSQNKHLKGIENSNKVALNLILKEKAKRIWFGNVKIGYGLASENRYDAQGNLMNFGKTNKYFFLTNLNNIGSDAIGDIGHLIKPYSIDNISSIGDDQTTSSLISLNTSVPNFKSSRTNFNNTELLSLNAIFNPYKSTKIKVLGFFNSDENDFYKDLLRNYNFNSSNFNTEEQFLLSKSKSVGFGKIDLLHDISETKSLETITSFNYTKENSINNLVFNNKNVNESLNGNNILFDQKAIYTNKLSNQKVLLLTGRYIYEKTPQDYTIDTFLYQDLFPDITSNNVLQTVDNRMNFAGLEAHYLNKKENGELFEFKIGNLFRQDQVNTSFFLRRENKNIFTPNDFQNNIDYLTNDLYLKGSYLWKYKKISISSGIGIHKIYNKLKEEKKHINNTPLFINPNLGIEWAINKHNNLSTTISYNATNLKAIDLLGNYFLTDYRSFNKGTRMFNQTNASSLTLNYQLGDWGDNFFINTFLIYNKYHNFFSTNSRINQNYIQSENILIKNKELFSITSDINRYFKSISSNLKFDLGFSTSNYKNVINDSDLREIISSNYRYGIELRSGFKGMFNYHIGTKWNTNKIISTTKNSFTNNTTFLDMSFIFNDNFHAEIQTERYFFGNLKSSNNTYYFADFLTKYKVNKTNMSISLVGKNLFNTDTFREFSVDDNSSSITEYRLLPRYVLLKLEYRF